MPDNTLIMRYQFAAFMGCLDAQKNETFNLIGEGFTQLTESKNPQEYSRKYISDKSTRTDLTGFAPQYDYTMDYIDGDPVVSEVAKITDNELLGSEARRNIVSVNLWSDPTGTACEAKMRPYAIIPNQKADGTDALVYSGSMKAAGDFVDGTFNITTKKFTPASEEAEETADPEETNTESQPK